MSLFVQTWSGAMADSCLGSAQDSSDVHLFFTVSFDGREILDANFIASR